MQIHEVSRLSSTNKIWKAKKDWWEIKWENPEIVIKWERVWIWNDYDTCHGIIGCELRTIVFFSFPEWLLSYFLIIHLLYQKWYCILGIWSKWFSTGSLKKFFWPYFIIWIIKLAFSVLIKGLNFFFFFFLGENGLTFQYE